MARRLSQWAAFCGVLPVPAVVLGALEEKRFSMADLTPA
jgi:hypothetical protein